MIIQLMKRDPAWKAVPWGIAMVCVSLLFVLRTPQNAAVAIYGGISSVFLIMAISLASNQDLWSNFLSALPVTARQIYLARVLAMLALLWLPVFGVAATQIYLATPLPSSSPWVVGAYATLLTLALQSGLMTGVKLPRGLIFGVFFLSLVLPLPLTVFFGSIRWDSRFTSRATPYLSRPCVSCRAGRSVGERGRSFTENRWRVRVKGRFPQRRRICGPGRTACF